MGLLILELISKHACQSVNHENGLRNASDSDY